MVLQYGTDSGRATLLTAREGPRALASWTLGAQPVTGWWGPQQLVLPDAKGLSLLLPTGKRAGRLPSDGWGVGSGAAVAGRQLVSAGKVSFTREMSEVGPGFSMVEHSLRLWGGDAPEAVTLFDEPFYDSPPQLMLWTDPQVQRVLVQHTRGSTQRWWCGVDPLACHPIEMAPLRQAVVARSCKRGDKACANATQLGGGSELLLVGERELIATPEGLLLRGPEGAKVVLLPWVGR